MLVNLAIYLRERCAETLSWLCAELNLDGSVSTGSAGLRPQPLHSRSYGCCALDYHANCCYFVPEKRLLGDLVDSIWEGFIP